MKQFDLSHFKKVQSTRSHTIMAHPDGHMIHLSHDNLDEKQLHDLHKLPFEDVKKLAKGGAVKAPGPKSEQDKISKGFKGALGLADGGEVIQEHHNPEAKMLGEVPSEQAGILGSSQALPEGEQPADMSMEQEQANLVPQQPMQPQQQQQDLFGTSQKLGNVEQGLGEQEQGIKEQTSAESALGKKSAGVQEKLASNLQLVQEDIHKQTQSILNDNKMLEDEIRKGTINPNHYVQSKSTLSNIMTGIGLILSGAGSGLSGGPNLASEFLNKQIHNDIEAQKNNLENKSSLLNYNLKKMGNIQDAMKLTQANYMTLAAAELEKAAAQSKDPMAQARALQEIGKLKVDSANLVASTVAQNNILRHAEKGNIAPEDQISLMQGEPAVKEKARGELETLRGAEAAVKNINDVFKDVSKLSTVKAVMGADLPFIGQVGSKEYTKLQTDKSQIINAIRSSMKGQGALSDQEIAQSIIPQLPAAGDDKAKLAVKQQALVKYLKSKLAGVGTHLNTLHVNYKPNFKAEPLE